MLISFVIASGPAYASTISEKEQQLSDLQSAIDKYQSLAIQKAAQVGDLKAQVEAISARIRATQAQIYATQIKIDKTQQEIDETIKKISKKNKELAYQKSVLNESLRVIYEEGNAGFLESFLAAKTLSDVIDRTEYLDSVENKIQTTMDKINKIKADLLSYKKDQQDKKGELVALRGEYSRKKVGLDSQRGYKNTLLVQTNGEQSRYKSLVASGQDQAVALSAQIYELRRQQSGNNGETIGGGTSGYAGYASANGGCWANDDWNFTICQCTSYAAWKWNRVYGKSWVNTRPGNGSAWNWPALARDQGYTVSTRRPRVGAFMIWGRDQIGGDHGHVAIVESINGSYVKVSEYNYFPPLSYGERGRVYWPGKTFIY